MKHLVLSFFAVVFFAFAAQGQNEQLTSGNIFLETNTSMGVGFGFGGDAGIGNTGFAFTSSDGASIYAFGGEAGYFIMDGLAAKVGIGYSGGNDDSGAANIFNYKIGAKYYVLDQFPVGVDLVGSSVEDLDENPMFLGLQAGYALFLGDNVSIEPGLRYNLSLNSDFYEDVFQLNLGFVVHL